MTLSFAPDAIETWPLSRLQPYAKNAKAHGPDQVAKIAASMAEFGWTVPCLVGEDGELIAGHGRVLAATQLGLTDAPVIVLGHLTEAQRRAYRLADNKLTELGSWDEALLSAELQELLAEDYDVSLIGFDDSELDALLAGEGGETTDTREAEDVVPEPQEEPISRPGDLWLLGNHRLLCGDATVSTDVGRLLDGTQADLCFCDPPYNVDYAGGAGAEKAGKGRRIKNDALGEAFGQFLQDACVLINLHTQGAVYICMSSSELHTLQAAFKAAGGHWSTFVIWAKDRFTLGRADYQRQYEPILYGWGAGGVPDGLFGAQELAHGIHGGDNETSLMLHFQPEKVDMSKAEDFRWSHSQGDIPPVGAIAHGWIASDVHPAGVAGEAHLATAEKGRVTAEHYVRQVIDVLEQITVQDISGYAPVPDPFR